jgi:hypothetical protein
VLLTIERRLQNIQLALEILTLIAATLPSSILDDGVDDGVYFVSALNLI